MQKYKILNEKKKKIEIESMMYTKIKTLNVIAIDFHKQCLQLFL